MREDSTPTGTPGNIADPHVEWWRQHQELGPQVEACATDDAIDPLMDERRRLEGLIATTAARTPAGLLAQARLAQIGLEWEAVDTHRDAIRILIEGLERWADEGCLSPGAKFPAAA